MNQQAMPSAAVADDFAGFCGFEDIDAGLLFTRQLCRPRVEGVDCRVREDG